MKRRFQSPSVHTSGKELACPSFPSNSCFLERRKPEDYRSSSQISFVGKQRLPSEISRDRPAGAPSSKASIPERVLSQVIVQD
ncbi:mCG148152 [Mus musculus]|nr:mCG148152 [Mus musculus]